MEAADVVGAMKGAAVTADDDGFVSSGIALSDGRFWCSDVLDAERDNCDGDDCGGRDD